MSIPPRARRKPGSEGTEATRNPDYSENTTVINLRRGKFSGVRVSNSADQAITSGVDTILTFDTERHDTDDYWNVANPTRLTVPITGFYLVWTGLVWDAGNYAVGQYFLVDGATNIAYSTADIRTTDMGNGAQSGIYLEKGQYVETVVNATANTNILTNTSAGTSDDWVSPEFSMTLIGVFRSRENF